MDQKLVELANLYDIETSDIPGCKIIENGTEKLVTENDVNKIFGLEEFQNNLSPAKGIINGLLFSIPIWIVIGLIFWWVMK
jgi:hypothetical protein